MPPVRGVTGAGCHLCGSDVIWRQSSGPRESGIRKGLDSPSSTPRHAAAGALVTYRDAAALPSVNQDGNHQWVMACGPRCHSPLVAASFDPLAIELESSGIIVDALAIDPPLR